MTAHQHDPSRRRLRRPPLRVQLTVLYAGLFVLLVVAVLAVSGLLERQGSTSNNGGVQLCATPSSDSTSTRDP